MNKTELVSEVINTIAQQTSASASQRGKANKNDPKKGKAASGAAQQNEKRLEPSKAQIEVAVDAVFATIRQALGRGEEVRLVKFGTFTVADRKASTGRNPRTGEEIDIKATRLPKFRPGKELKATVAGTVGQKPSAGNKSPSSAKHPSGR